VFIIKTQRETNAISNTTQERPKNLMISFQFRQVINAKKT